MARRLGGVRPRVPPQVLGLKYGAAYMLAAAGAQWLDRWHPFAVWRPLLLGAIAATGAYLGARFADQHRLKRERAAQVAALTVGSAGGLAMILLR